jgi:hypothetical protein
MKLIEFRLIDIKDGISPIITFRGMISISPESVQGVFEILDRHEHVIKDIAGIRFKTQDQVIVGESYKDVVEKINANSFDV